MKTKFLVFAAVGAAVTLALTSKKGTAWRKDMMKDADEWRKKLTKLAGETGSQIGDLKQLISKEITGLGKDARERIMNILDEGTSAGKTAKNKVAEQLNG